MVIRLHSLFPLNLYHCGPCGRVSLILHVLISKFLLNNVQLILHLKMHVGLCPLIFYWLGTIYLAHFRPPDGKYTGVRSPCSWRSPYLSQEKSTTHQQTLNGLRWICAPSSFSSWPVSIIVKGAVSLLPCGIFAQDKTDGPARQFSIILLYCQNVHLRNVTFVLAFWYKAPSCSSPLCSYASPVFVHSRQCLLPTLMT